MVGEVKSKIKGMSLDSSVVHSRVSQKEKLDCFSNVTLIPASRSYFDPTELGETQPYPATVQLFRQGANPHGVFFIERGLVKLIRLEKDGSELIVMVSERGAFLGAESVIIEKAYPVTATTLTTSSLRRVSAPEFRRLLMQNSSLSWHLHQAHSHDISDQMIRVAQLGCLSARTRFEELIWHLIVAMELNLSASEIRLEMPLRNWEIAELIAVTPEHLSRMLRQMETEGVLRRHKGWLIFSTAHWVQLQA